MTDFSLEKAAMAADGAGIRSGGDPAGGRLHPRP